MSTLGILSEREQVVQTSQGSPALEILEEPQGREANIKESEQAESRIWSKMKSERH